MFVGHVAAGLALGRVAPRLPLAALLFAALLPDFLFGVFALAGIEGIAVSQGAGGAVVTYRYPLSHSLAAILFWSVAFGGLSWYFWRRPMAGIAMAAATFSHFLFDFAMHDGLPLLGPDSAVLGLGLGRDPLVATALEGVLIALALLLHWRGAAADGEGRPIAMTALVVVAAAYGLGGPLLMPLPEDGGVIATAILAQVVVVTGVAGVIEAWPRWRDWRTGRVTSPAFDEAEWVIEEAIDLEIEGEEESAEEPAEEPAKAWPEARIAFVQKLWGEGYLTPGGAQFLMERVSLLGLDESMSLLHIGAGLGGPARTMAEKFGVWVTGMETDPDLAAAGKAMSHLSSLEKKAKITLFDPDDIRVKKGGYDAVIGIESFFTIADKEGLFQAIETALRPNRYLLFTDLVVVEAGPPDETVLRWLAREPIRPHLWSAKQTVDLINETAMEVVLAEDITEVYKRLVIKGWSDFIADLEMGDLTPADVRVIIDECEYWLLRLAALDAGAVRLYRFEATRKAKSRR